MSRIGKIPIDVPKGVTVTVEEGAVSVKGPKGTLHQPYRREISIAVEDGKVNLTRDRDTKTSKALHGTYRSLIKNMIDGVTKGFEKVLEIHGVGYRGRVEGEKLILQIGKSHEVIHEIPEGITITVEKNTIVKVSGSDRHMVGQVAAKIRASYPPEPYQGKGIRYQNEHVRRKAGKKMVG